MSLLGVVLSEVVLACCSLGRKPADEVETPTIPDKVVYFESLESAKHTSVQTRINTADAPPVGLHTYTHTNARKTSHPTYIHMVAVHSCAPTTYTHTKPQESPNLTHIPVATVLEPSAYTNTNAEETREANPEPNPNPNPSITHTRTLNPVLRSFVSVMSEGIEQSILYSNGAHKRVLLMVDMGGPQISWKHQRTGACDRVLIREVVQVCEQGPQNVIAAHARTPPSRCFTLFTKSRHIVFRCDSEAEASAMVGGLSLLLAFVRDT